MSDEVDWAVKPNEREELLVKAENPEVLEVIQKNRARNYALSRFSVPVVDEKRMCVWCMKNELATKRQKYCSTACSESAWASMNPQNEMGLQVLLLRQEFKCASCGYDYTPALKAVQEKAKGRNIDPSLNKFNYWVMKILKNQFKWHVPEERARQPEIDHIIPIGLDGQSLGFDNHQVLCRSCHLEKTKEDHAKIREFKKRK